MNYPFSNNITELKPSAIREILKFSSLPGYISFAAGNPAPEALPTAAVAEITADIMANSPVDALQYSVTEGYAPLRSHLKQYMRSKHGVGRDFDEIIITSGAQQVMNLTAMVLCNPGDTVICENPSFIGSLNAFRSFGLKPVGVEVESDGMSIEKLGEALAAHPETKFIYTIPTFQNPSGTCMSLEKRRALYALAKKHGVLILEDNPYSDTRFDGDDIPCIKSFDEDGIVIYAGTFSKVISPGLRVGYTVAPAEIVSKMVVCKQTSDVHTNIFGQMICHKFMTEYDYESHLKNIKEVYRKKCALMTGLIDRHLGSYVKYVKPQGGLFIWCELPRDADMQAFCKAAVDRRVAVVPGSAFCTETDGKSNCFRLNFSTPTDAQITEGMRILGETAVDFFK